MKRAALVVALLAGACASGSPAPISYGPNAPAPQRQTPRPQRAQAEPEPAPPERQQTPEHAPGAEPAWADGEGTPLSAFALRPEDAQPFDPANLPRTHRVGDNESLYEIATRYQAPLRALIDQNSLEPPYALAPGRVLQLPPPRFHTVARGENFEEVARRYNVDLRSLALLNRMQPPYHVRPGDRVVLPAMARVMAEPAPPTPAPAAPPLVQGSGRFVWPLRGDVVTRFGSQPGGVTIDGVEISGRAGASVTAAADGDVFYANQELEGYGVVILIRHADNYVTAYGHNRRALVREGDRVRAGQQIAELGERPDGRSRLLFQVRRGTSAVDPMPLLGPRGD
jgi:murein DD-endopeptidase MepM/ murein hydrolase activator NlpD